MNAADCAVVSQAFIVVIATYAKYAVSEATLERWRRNASATNEHRGVESVNDCLGVLWQVDFPSVCSAGDISDAFHRMRQCDDLPHEQLLGTTTVLVLKRPPGASAQSIMHDLLETQADSMLGGICGDLAEVYAGIDPTLIVALCDPGVEADKRISHFLYGPLRMLETFRHKIEFQYSIYHRDYRSRVLEIVSDLDSQLTAFIKVKARVRHHEDEAEESLKLNKRTVDAYATAALVLNPVRQIKAMVAANLRNLRETIDRFVPHANQEGAGAIALRHRAMGLEMRLDQIEADLGMAEPVFDAARSVGQFHNSQLLVQLIAIEGEQDRRREREAQMRERQNLGLVVLGVWLGVSEIWSAWVSMLPEERRPPGTRLLLWCFLPAAVGIGVYVAILLIKKATGRPK